MTRATPDTTALMSVGLNLIQQALSIYGHDLRLSVSNRRFQEMFDLPDALVTVGASFADTIRYLAERGEYGPVGNIDGFVASRVAQAQAFAPHYMERTRPNGRAISVEGFPLPEGGWVTVYTDISRTKHQEALLRTRSEALSDQVLSHTEDLAAANRKLSATITALEEAKRQISEAEARSRLTAEMMPAHIAHVDREWRYTYSNRRLGTVMPGSAPEPIGNHVAEVLGPQPYQAIGPYIERALQGEASVFEFTHEPSSRRIRVALTPDPGNGGVYILSMDITEETRTRTMLQQTRRREMAAQLTSGLAHDFSNLLTIILGMQSRLQSMPLPEPARDLVAATVAAARRGGGLLNRIADMTGPREHQPVATALPSFLRDLRTLARSALPDKITLEVNNLVGAESFLLDPGMLQDSLLNLILNARDATPPGGVITLTVHTIRDLWLVFTVTDTGEGFSDEALNHAVEPFFTSKGVEGSGLGLSMVYDMTKLAGGRLLLGNTDEGARVEVRLPYRPAPAETIQRGLVLLVEDNADLRRVIRDMLQDLGHPVIEATSVAEALDLLAQIPDITVVLSDIMLGGDLTGLDLIERLPVPRPAGLMTSLPFDHPLCKEALDRLPVLHKPFTRSQLDTLLKDILPHERPADQHS